ncbi:MAG: saccharopine dehydrogenase NADP-binding domain-containing protein [Actinomycetota bacterium]|nr:saccharopine dehydrogenase NADP-binding domain-containing protein [Actinomycetota bacterium]
MPTHRRDHDLVLLGATGFTGALTAQQLARHADKGTRWALAGRSQGKLEALRDRLGVDVPLLHADVTDEGSLRDLAASTRVVTTTVGPYIRHGAPLVAACAREGTDYTDLAGEPEFVDRMYVAHHAEAQRTGARLVHACGFDSIPHDLGVLFTVHQLPEGVPLNVRGFVRASGAASGGTFHSAMTGFSRPKQNLEAAKARRQVEQRSGARHVRGVKRGPLREESLGAWAIPLPTIDPQIILRSARALERYGPDFSYGHFAAVKRLPVAAGGVAGVGALFALAQVPPARKLLMDRLQPGQGPSEAKRAKGWFKVRFIGEGGGRRVVTEVSGGDPGYGETASMLAQAALCLAHDDLPQATGQVTTAQAMGDALTARLRDAGIAFDVLER